MTPPPPAPAPARPAPLADLLSGLDPAQTEAVTNPTHPLCILAGAGSGKTRVLTRRIAHRVLTGSASARHVLAVTFTRKAAGELTERLASLAGRHDEAPVASVGTFHSLAYAMLRRRWADRGEPAPSLLDRKGRIVFPLLRRHRLPPTVQGTDVAAEIEWAKARMIGPDRFAAEADAAGRRLPAAADVLARIYGEYETEKKKRGLVDFDDLLVSCADAVERDPDFAAAVRHRHRHLFVDEFQDVNPLQFRLLRGWLGDRPDLCVVGDPNQAIYAWNGADPGHLGRFAERFPGAEVVRLDHNYRSTPPILAAAARVLGQPTPTAHRRGGGPPTVVAYADDTAEAKAVANRIRDGHDGGRRAWSSFAVLTRTNAQIAVFERALTEAGVPHRVRGGGSFLDQPEVKAALGSLSGSGSGFSDWVTRLESAAGASGGNDDRRSNLQTLLRLARDYASDEPRPSGPGFVAYLSATIRADDVPASGGADAVDLVTFHRAKGLEWATVFVCGLEKGLVPISHSADDPEAEAEERRLLYVALTRARDDLHCSWAEERTFGNRAARRSPSPWLGLVGSPTGSVAGSGATRPGPGRPGRDPGAGGRRRVGATGEADDDLLAALKEWRTSVARSAGIPAYYVFNDASLAAIARTRPRGRGALLGVPGVGPAKADRHGDDVLAIVARHT